MNPPDLVRTSPSSRAEELRRNLDAVKRRIQAACDRCDRSPADVGLVVVTKTFPIEDVRLLAALGVQDVGENHDQEARVKASSLPDLRWHFVGGIQTNKARRIATYASVVHSVDRPGLLVPLSRGAEESGRVVDVLIQVSVDGDGSRGGALAAVVPSLADQVAECPALRLIGVMAVAPVDWDPDRAFALVHEISAAVRAGHPAAGAISAGMSGDLEAAIRHGSTMVRVGSAILGFRAPAVR